MQAKQAVEPRVMHYLDLVALAVLRAPHGKTKNLREAVVMAACAMGKQEDTFKSSLETAVASVGIT